MLGAVLGDIIGSPYEFDRGDKTKDFPLFSAASNFTDDTVMTIAVAEALLASGRDADAGCIRQNVIHSMQKWGRKYPYAGYGSSFIWWLNEENPKPYGSYGNGSAMRVSFAGWYYESLSRTREAARATAEVSHNHPEGIKGAEATASCIYMAHNGASKKEIQTYVVNEFGYDLSKGLDKLRRDNSHNETCQVTMPLSITAFLESTDFEDAVRNAVSLGGDTDTIAAITGSIAEAFYGITEELKQMAMSYCKDAQMLDVIQKEYEVIGE